jgi:hypothetical protein
MDGSAMFLKKKSRIRALSRDGEPVGLRAGKPAAPGQRSAALLPALSLDWRIGLALASAAGLLLLAALTGESYPVLGEGNDAIELMEGDFCQTREQTRCLTADARPAEIGAYFGVPEDRIEMMPGGETLRFRLKGTAK